MLDGITIRELVPQRRQPRPDEQYTMFHPSEVELSATTKTILEDVERLKPARVVFDSLSELRLLAGNPLRYRRQILALKQFFAGRSCTVLLLDDMTSADHDLQVQSIAHGVIRLEQLYPRIRRGAATTARRQVSRRRAFAAAITITSFNGAASRFIRVSSPANTAVRRQWKAWQRHAATGHTARRRHRARHQHVDRRGGGNREVVARRAVCVGGGGARPDAALFIFDESIHTLLTRAAGLGIDLRAHVILAA